MTRKLFQKLTMMHIPGVNKSNLTMGTEIGFRKKLGKGLVEKNMETI